MADGETAKIENAAAIDPFKDFVQSEYKDGALVEPPKSDPTAEELAAAEKAKADETKNKADEDEFKDEDVLPADADAEAKRIDELARAKAKKMAMGRIGQLTAQTRKQQRELDALKTGAEPVKRPAAGAGDAPSAEVSAELEARFAADPKAPKAPNPEKFDFGNVDTRYIDAYHAFAHAKQKWLDKAAEVVAVEHATEAASAQAGKDFRDKLDAFIAEGDKVDGFAKTKAAIESNAFPVSLPVAQLVMSSEVGHALAIHLAEDPTFAKDISALPEYRQVARVAALEAELIAKAKTAKPAARTASSAPAPITNTNGQSASSGSAEESTDFTAAEAAANKALGRR